MADERIPPPATAFTSIPPTAGLPAAAQQPAGGDGATPRQSWVWPAAAGVLVVGIVVAYGLVNSGATALHSPLPPDAIFARGSPAVVQVVIQDRQNRTI